MEVNLSFSIDDFAKALEQHDYQFQVGSVVRGTISSHESDGVYVDIGGKSAAFLPAREAGLEQVMDVAAVLPLHEERDFLIIRDQDADGQVILSIRRLEIKQAWERLSQMQANDEAVQVRVSGINKGGVTVHLMGMRGFIPRSHLTDKENLEALVGQALTVSFLEVNAERNKLVLSQRLAARASAMNRLELGQLISGKVANIKPFGAFVEFDGVTGLLHINQVSKNYVASLPAFLEVGQSIQAVIVDLDEFKGRISLSTKVLEKHPGEILENMNEVMADAANRVKSFGQMLAERDS
ncbi:MAG: S1 RNA-binding domain-containing protein [Cyanothece sp. SIO1E1]|nr:S1 RNA-binding domain-containing protein [Cyanothece sp. SIO1E1]